MPKLVRSLEFVVCRKESTHYLQSTTHSRRWRHGYTLIEFLVVLGLLSITVGSALLFLTSILRGTNQSNISAEVKQNGQAVLDSLDRQIRGAKSASSISGATLLTISPDAVSGVSLLQHDGKTLYVVCFRPTSSKNGWIGTASQAAGGAVPTLTEYENGAVTNRDTTSGTSITDCSLTASAPASTISGDVVSIDFTADRAVKAPTRSDFNASATFQTTISLRKY